jgi:hypothetical protein
MTFIARKTLMEPYFISIRDFDLSHIPDLDRRAQISGIFHTGSGLLVPDEMTKEVRVGRRALRDEFMSNGGIRIISQAFRDLLEELDGGHHQILPVTLRHQSRTETRYILNVHVKQDTVIDALSDVRKHPKADNIMYFESLEWGKGPVDVSIRASSRGPHHLWREKRYPGSLLLSDRLHAEILRRRLRVFQMRQAIDV